MLIEAYLLLGFASRLVDWVLVLLGLPSILLLILLRRLEKEDTRLRLHSYCKVHKSKDASLVCISTVI